MGKQAFERKLAALEALRADLGSAESAAHLQKALADTNNYVVSKAAGLAEEAGHRSLAPALVATFERFLENGAKRDPQCWAKTAVSKALVNLGHRDPEVYLAGVRCFQWEPVMGGTEDTATVLRGHCALALVDAHLPVQDVLAHLTDLLVDDADIVQIQAVRALAALNRAEGAYPLRLVALQAAQELERLALLAAQQGAQPERLRRYEAARELLGECCVALLAIAPESVRELLGRVMSHSAPDVRGEVAGALAASREPVAMELLEDAWRREQDCALRRSMLMAAGVSPAEGGFDFLLRVAAQEASGDVETALRALATNRIAAERGDKIVAAIRECGDRRMAALWQRLKPAG